MGLVERKEREKEQRRQQIITSAERLFVDQGVKLTTMEQIANDCEISRGTLYLYFKSKEELLSHIMMKSMDILIGLMKNAIEKAETIESKLEVIGKNYLLYYKNYRTYFKMFNMMTERENFREIGESSVKLFQKSGDVWKLIVDVIKPAIKSGYFRENTDPYELSITLWSASNGVIQLLDHFGSAHGNDISDNQQDAPGLEVLSEFRKINLEAILAKLWEHIINGNKK